MTAFMNDALRILREKGYHQHCYPLGLFSKTVEANGYYTARKVLLYKWAGVGLLTAVPLISALLSISISFGDNSPNWLPAAVRIPLSLTLTLLTILNSIFKPSERFGKACRIGIGIDRFTTEFLMDLERLAKIDEPTLIELIDVKQKEFERYQIELIGLFMPNEITDPNAGRATGKRRGKGFAHGPTQTTATGPI